MNEIMQRREKLLQADLLAHRVERESVHIGKMKLLDDSAPLIELATPVASGKRKSTETFEGTEIPTAKNGTRSWQAGRGPGALLLLGARGPPQPRSCLALGHAALLQRRRNRKSRLFLRSEIHK